MAHLKEYLVNIATKGSLAFCLLAFSTAAAQYQLRVVPVDQDSSIFTGRVRLQTNFKSQAACVDYVKELPAELQGRGYPVASIDSIHYDSTFATMLLFLGQNFQLAYINTEGVNRKLLSQSGWSQQNLEEHPIRIEQFHVMREKMLDYLENNGYPFARVQLDSITFKQEKLFARLRLDLGPLYRIDSIRVYGRARISNTFLQGYLDIKNGSLYQEAKLQNISKRILELPFMEQEQSWTVTMLGTGSILNLYLQPKKSSQVNVLLGLLPSNEQTLNNKLLVTGEANVNLRNALGNGEYIGLNWQNIQVKSPRLNLSFQQPYMFGTPFGISTTFDLFKKDSSFLNLSFLLGVQYGLTSEQSGRVYIETRKTNLLNIDTLLVKAIKRLPNEMDVSSVNLGIEYEINKTNYRLNPKSGSELRLTMSAGTRTVHKNNVILKLSDPSFSYSSLYDSVTGNSYQFRVRMSAAHYFQLGRQSTFKTALNGGLFQSPSIFRNELFQIGGYKLLRGFDEESIYASRYLAATFEYRYLLGLNSFLFTFVDAGWAANTSSSIRTSNGFLGAGLGLAFETKAGIFNISYAAGKRNDTNFNLRQSKIHLGYVSYF
jgi:outer membrane protein assembly factor BamA